MRRLLFRSAAALALALLAACTQKNTADLNAQQTDAAAAAALGIDRLLLFPNPIGTDPFAQDGGTFETDTSDYATAYYAAIDATNAKDTIDKWRTANGFQGYANPARPGTEHRAVFRDVKDLGYGRNMNGRFNSDDNSVAFYVENYNVTPNGSAGYSSELNVDAAIRRDTQWHVGTNAIEWTTTPCMNIANGYPYNYDPPDCNGTIKFAKYYNFSSADGTRQLAVDLDGHGKKAMPGPCITCHGGRGDPLTPADVSGKPRFPLVENGLSRKRGDVQARLHGMNVDSFDYSTTQAGFAKSDLQPFLKDFNQWILCTYPSPTLTPGLQVTGAWGTCTRPTAGANEWQGTAGPMIESWYGGTGMPAATFSDTYVPAGWNTNTAIPGTSFTETALYQNVVEPYCRTCHILRGTANQNDIDFMTIGVPAAGTTPATGFRSYADRIKVHVFDRGNMPLAQIPHSDFWNSSAPQMLASFVDAMLGAGTATSNGAPLMPGRPIADPGPDRMVRTGANAVLTGENSLFASSFSWTKVSGPSTPTITNANGMVAIFNAGVAGAYVVNLSVNAGASSKNVTITVDDNFPDPLNIKFAQVKNVLQNIQHTTAQTTGKCIACHVSPAVSPTPPIFYNSTLDRDNSGTVDATDEAWFLKAIQGRVNLTEIAASPLLRKPSGNHHKGLMLLDVADTTSNGGLRNYSVLYNWILAGMQPGGAAANAGANSTVQVTFSGTPFYASIPLDGSLSVNAAGYAWTVVSGPNGPTGAAATITNPTSISAALSPTAPPVLNVPNVGTYVVQLSVSNGTFSDTAARTIVVTENPITASFTPLAGSTPVTFSGNPLRGSITLTSTSSGSPANCQWQVTGPAGATLESIPVPAAVTTPCTSSATLNVPSSAIGATSNVTLTAFGIGSSVATNALLIADGTASVVARLNNTVTTQSVVFGSSGINTTIPTNTLTNGTGTAGTASFPNVVSTVSLDGSASTTPSGTNLTYSWCLSAQPDAANFPASVATCPSQTSSAGSATLSMTVRATGSYTVQLTVTNGLSTNSTTTSITVNPSRGTRFTDMISKFGSIGCTGCHNSFGAAYFNPASNLTCCQPPDWVNETNNDLTTLYQRVRQRVAIGSPSGSLLLLNPENVTNGTNTNGHGGGCQPDFGCGVGTGVNPDNGSNATTFSNWILDGAPPGN